VDEGALTPYDEALEIVLANVQPVGPETVTIAEALGCFLAEPAVARHPAPRFEQSSMDGFAVRYDDVSSATTDQPVILILVGQLPAGDSRELKLEAGQTIKVFTGSRLPVGTDAVVMKEFVTASDGNDAVAIAWRVKPGDHIRRVGEEFAAGSEIMPIGTRVSPPVVGMLAFLGLAEINVGRFPRATVITMGDELVGPGETAGSGQIHDANGPALMAALSALGLNHINHIRVSDDPQELQAAMARGLTESDILITIGGASVGDHDHVHGARAALGIEDLFAKVAIKPGKPNLFGLSKNGVPVFGLPGNPVSALVSYHQLVKPALITMMGGRYQSEILAVSATQEIRPNKGRLNWLRGSLKFAAGEPPQNTAELVAGQGSHMLSGLAMADVLLEVPADSDGSSAGEIFSAVRLKWQE